MTETICKNKNYDASDFFLLLLEYVEKFENNDIFTPLKYVKPDLRSKNEKKCDEFKLANIKNNEEYTKSVDVYARYIAWDKDEIKLTTPALYTELNKHYIYKRSEIGRASCRERI